jgi:hypothetical protein
VYGSPEVDGARAKTRSDVFELLCSLGFRQKEARHLVDRVRPHMGAETGTEAALKMALAEAHLPGVREAPAPYAPSHGPRLAPTRALGHRKDRDLSGVREAPAPYAPSHAPRLAPTWGLGHARDVPGSAR